MKDLPLAMPDRTALEYADLITEIRDRARYNTELCSLTGHPELAAACVDEAVRILRNTATFLQHQIDEKEQRERTTDNPIVDALASVARGDDFGGIGTTKSKDRQYKHWHNQQSTDSEVDPQYSLREHALTTIGEVRSFLA